MQKVNPNACIYIIVGPDGQYYIGQTIRGWRRRWLQHQYPNPRTYIDRAINKHGPEQFECVPLIQQPMTGDEINAYESILIGLLGANELGVGYNLTSGGSNGFAIADVVKAKIGAKQRGKKDGPLSAETKKKISDSKIGVPKSLETRARMSLAKRGRPHKSHNISPEAKLKVIASHQTPEAKEKRRLSIIASWPLRKARMCAMGIS